MKNLLLTLALVVLVSTGCTGSDPAPKAGSGTSSNTEHLLKEEPKDAIGITKAKNEVKDGDTITLVGRIGGSKAPFNESMAAFTIVDMEIPYCQPEEGCPYPWDYCCTQDRVVKGIANIQIVGKDKKVVMTKAETLLKVEPLDVVVVSGLAKKDEKGNLTVSANQIFVRK